MDLDLLTKLFGGSSANPAISALLPLLLGGNAPNLSSLLGNLSSGGMNRGQGASFPPLFGAKPSDAIGSNGGIVNFLGGILNGNSAKQTTKTEEKEYPYELQYNHPYSNQKPLH